MKRLRLQSGFTLVEVVIVLSIMSLLLAGVLAGQSALRRNASFTASIDQVKNQISGLQNEANQNVTKRGGADQTGRTSGTTWGTLIEFDAASPTAMNSWTLVQDENNPSGQLYKCDQQTTNLKDGVQYIQQPATTVTKQAIIFRAYPAGVFSVNNFVDPGNSIAGTNLCSQVALGPVAGSTPTGDGNPSGTGGITCPDGQLPDGLGGCKPPLPPTGNCNDAGFICGLYGQYYDDTSWTHRVSAFSDPGVGNLGSAFSWANIDPNSSTDLGALNVFTPKFRRRAADRDATDKGVSWSGQFKTPGAGTTAVNNTICARHDDALSISLDGSTIFNEGGQPIATPKTCVTYSAIPGWHKLEVKLTNSCCAISYGENTGAQLSEPQGATTVEIPNSRYRRPLDVTLTGDSGTCSSGCNSDASQGGLFGANAQCVNFDVWSCSMAPPATASKAIYGTADYASCAAAESGNTQTVNYTVGGVQATGNYKMDLSYGNWPAARGDGTYYPVPAGYNFKVCVKVNGAWLNSSQPFNLQAWDPKNTNQTTRYAADFTYTVSGVPLNSGSNAVKIVWLNDSFQAGVGNGTVAVSCTGYTCLGHAGYTCSLTSSLTILCSYPVPVTDTGYDANFNINRLDFYRDVNPLGQLSSAAPLPKNGLLSHMTPTAHAASPCSLDVLNPANYDGGNGCFSSPTQLYFQVNNDTSKTGYIKVVPATNTVDRVVQ